MDKDHILDRIHSLEREVALLREELVPAEGRWALLRPLQRLGSVILHYWVLISLLAAAATAVFVKFRYDIDPFEEYKNAFATKRISEFYRSYGDRMLATTEWEAAEDAYLMALEVNPNNTEATYGIVKAQLFQPLEGQDFFIPELVTAKLEFLRSTLPDPDDDYQLHFLQGTYYMLMGDDDNARVWLESAIKLNRSFEGSYLSLGVVEQRSFNYEEARKQYKKVLNLNSQNAIAYNNLGYLDLLELDFKESLTNLNESYALSRSLLTAISIGDAYQFAGDFNSALHYHGFVLDQISQPGVENERFTTGAWIYNSMSLRPGDQETRKYWIEVSSLVQKQAIVTYRVSFDLAMIKNFAEADRVFKDAQELDPSGQFDEYFRRHIDSMINNIEMDDEVRRWLETHRNLL